jgi:hypothetical protein
MLHRLDTQVMQAAGASETSANFDQTTRRYNPEDSHLHTRSRENLKSQDYDALLRPVLNLSSY